MPLLPISHTGQRPDGDEESLSTDIHYVVQGRFNMPEDAQFTTPAMVEAQMMEQAPKRTSSPRLMELANARMLHTMLRVRDLDRSLAFYTVMLGMQLLRRKDFPDGRFTLAFVGYGDEDSTTVIELTYNWDQHEYVLGSGYGHVAIGVTDVSAATCALAAAGVTVTRVAGPLKGDPGEIIAFIEDPDGYKVELIQRN